MQENAQKKSPIKARIIEFLTIRGVSQYEFYKNTGVTRGILGQNNGISEDNITRFLAYYKEVSAEWLIRGDGDMIRQPSDGIEQSVQECSSNCSNEGKTCSNTVQSPPDTIVLQLLDKVSTQAKEIGRLERLVEEANERAEEAEQRAAESAARARNEATAGVA